MSLACEHAGDAPDVGNEEPCFGTCDGFFPVFCHSAAPSKPCEGSLDYPPAWDDLKAFRGVGALDDLQCPAPDLFQSGQSGEVGGDKRLKW